MKNRLNELVFKSGDFSRFDLELIREVVGCYPRLSQQELANTVCELLEWRGASGGLMVWECRELPERLESDGWLKLPAAAKTKPKGSRTSIPRTSKGERQEELRGSAGEFVPVVLHRVANPADRLLWRELGQTTGQHPQWKIRYTATRHQGCVFLGSDRELPPGAMP